MTSKHHGIITRWIDFFDTLQNPCITLRLIQHELKYDPDRHRVPILGRRIGSANQRYATRTTNVTAGEETTPRDCTYGRRIHSGQTAACPRADRPDISDPILFHHLHPQKRNQKPRLHRYLPCRCLKIGARRIGNPLGRTDPDRQGSHRSVVALHHYRWIDSVPW